MHASAAIGAVGGPAETGPSTPPPVTADPVAPARQAVIAKAKHGMGDTPMESADNIGLPVRALATNGPGVPLATVTINRRELRANRRPKKPLSIAPNWAADEPPVDGRPDEW